MPFSGMQMPFQMNGTPFQMPQMPFQMNGMQMPFPFNMFAQAPGASQTGETKESTDTKNGCSFPFMPFQMPQMPFQMNGMPFQMPQMPFQMNNMPPFNFFPMMPNQQGEQSTQNANPFAFFGNMMSQMNGTNPMQMMFPLYYMMQSMAPFFQNGEQKQGNQNSIQMQGMNIPVELIQKALQVSASPAALEMLQKLLDTLFDVYINTSKEAPEATSFFQPQNTKDRQPCVPHSGPCKPDNLPPRLPTEQKHQSF